jgi:hypothetical protein
MIFHEISLPDLVQGESAGHPLVGKTPYLHHCKPLSWLQEPTYLSQNPINNADQKMII